MRARITAKPKAPRKLTTGRSKYRAIRTTVDGVTFASKAEARRYEHLRVLEDLGAIGQLMLQPKFSLIVSGRKVGTYIADFQYRVMESGQPDGPLVIEDVKGMLTPVYRLKKKMVEAQYGITITEVRA